MASPGQQFGSVIGGFGLYDRPLLASYSRSGTNWIRYFIENTSGHPTPGQMRLIQGDNFWIDRAHCAYPIMKLYKKVVLVIRDYRECILRHHEHVWPNYSDVVTFLTDERLAQPASWYIKNLEAFDLFQGNKHIVYYEDLLVNPQKEFAELAIFLRLDPQATRIFLGDLDANFRKSVQAYTKGGHGSYHSQSF